MKEGWEEPVVIQEEGTGSLLDPGIEKRWCVFCLQLLEQRGAHCALHTPALGSQSTNVVEPMEDCNPHPGGHS